MVHIVKKRVLYPCDKDKGQGQGQLDNVKWLEKT